MKNRETMSFTTEEMAMLNYLNWNRKILKKALHELIESEYQFAKYQKEYPNASEVIHAKWIKD